AGVKLPSTSACTVLMDYFRGLQPAPAETAACKLDNAQADVVIAMAPHPVNSVLALTFDREIESIQRAAGSAGYEFHQHFFPLTPPAAGQEAGANRGSDREPGLLLFRGPARPLVVLVLPETPSGYIDPAAFEASIDYARHLGKGSDTIRVLGPFASGTV